MGAASPNRALALLHALRNATALKKKPSLIAQSDAGVGYGKVEVGPGGFFPLFLPVLAQEREK